MLKKTALFLKDGFPKFENRRSIPVKLELFVVVDEGVLVLLDLL